MEGKEKRKLQNRMKWVLTGEKEFWKDSNAIGREAGVQKKIEDSKKMMEGKKRAKRKAKGSKFFKRPDKRFTEKRRALEKSKSDKIDSDHNPDESFNYADDEEEDQDVEMADNNPDDADDSDE